MRDLNDYYYFVQVVEKKGFGAAGRALKVPKSTLSRRITELEARLGVRLIQRNSRSFVVTETGAEFYRHAAAMLADAEAAEHAVRGKLAEPSGTVRMTCSIGTAESSGPLIARFLMAHPKVNVVQHATNRFVDLLEDGYDLGLRAHSDPLPPSSLVQRRLARTPWHLFAAPSYLERAGNPQTVEELSGHAGLFNRSDDPFWRIREAGGREVDVRLTARIRSDDFSVLRNCALMGVGIVALPHYKCRAELAAGVLRRVLPQCIAWPDAQITLLMPSRRGVLPSVRALIEFLVAEYPALVDVKPPA